jgi:hypothetical protein
VVRPFSGEKACRVRFFSYFLVFFAAGSTNPSPKTDVSLMFDVKTRADMADTAERRMRRAGVARSLQMKNDSR